MPIAKVVVGGGVGGGGSVNSNAGEDENGRSPHNPPRKALLTRGTHSMALIIGGDLALR